MRILTLAILIPSVAFGAITNVAVLGTTATQALIQYTWSPSSDVCKVESSVSSTFSPLDHDVDPALFTNSNLDSRSGATNNNGDRQFVVGTRSAPTALDGTFVSRALQAATHHFFRITCPSSGGTTATGTFDTTTIPYGSLYQDPPGKDYPTIPVNQRNFGLPATSGALFSAFQTGGALAHNFMQATSNPFTHPGTGSFTVITFVKQNSRTSLNVLVGDVDQQLNPSNSGYLLFYANGPDTYSFYTVDSGGTGREVDGTSHPVLGNWACVAGIHDATVPTATVNSIWVNGVMESSNAAGSGIINTASEFGVMGAPNPPSGAWSLDGSLAMTMKISAKLTSTQINAICNSGSGQNSSDLAAYLTAQSLPGTDFLYEDTPTVTADASGNGTTLTIVGTVSQGTGPSTIPGTSVPIIDPSTGLGWVSQAALPNDTSWPAQTGAASAISWTDPDTTSWNNPTFITSGTAPGATSNSGTTGKLIGHYGLPGGFAFTTDKNPYQGSNTIGSLTYVTVTVTGLVSSGGSAPGHTINVCAFMKTQTTCDDTSQTYSQVLTTSSASYTFGTGAVGDLMRITLNVGIPTWDLQAANGINIGIWKPNASTDIVTISSVTVGWSTGVQPGGNDGGGYNTFSPALVTGPDCVGGVCEQGYVFGGISPLQYFIGKTSGRIHWVGSVNPRDCGPALNTYYSAGNPLIYYCIDTQGSPGTLYQMTQVPINGTNPWNDYPSGLGQYTAGNSFNNNICGSAPCIQKTTLSSNLPTLIQNFTSATLSHSPIVFDPTVFTSIEPVGTNPTSGEVVVAYLIPGSQFGQLWWAVVFDPAITSNASGGTSGGAAGNNGCIGGGNPGCVVAAVPTWAVDGMQWSTWKGLQIFKGDSAGERWLTLTTFFANPSSYAIQMVDGITNGDGSINQLTGTAHSTCSSPPAPVSGKGCDQITIQTNIPTPQGSGAFAYAPGSPLLVNSLIDLTPFEGQGTGTEVMRVLSVTPSATSGEWKVLVERGANNNSLQASGSLPKIYMFPAMNQAQEINGAPGGQAFLNYGNYPYGVDLSGNRLAIPVVSYLTGCHTVFTNGSGLFGCEADQDHRSVGGAVTGLSNSASVRSQLSQALAPSITNGQATFNQDTSPLGGYKQSHFAQSYGIPISGAGTPYLGWDCGGSPCTPGTGGLNLCVLQTGTLCKFSAGAPPPGVTLPYSKVSPLGAYYGHIRLTNISGPGSVIGSTSADLLKICIVAVINECVSGSAVGEVYINAPTTEANYFNYDNFYAQDLTNVDAHPLVVRNMSNWFSGTTEIKWPNISEASGSRLLTHGQHLTYQSIFDNAQYTPDGGFVIVQMPQVGDGSAQNAWLVGAVPPEQSDNINRSTWWKQTIPVPAVAGATSAYIRAGYAEFGNPSSGQFFASERLENSVFTTGTTTVLGSGAVPFFYETTESGSWSATSCTSGCSIQLNIIPQRMMYGQIVWKNGGTTIKTGPVFVVPSP